MVHLFTREEGIVHGIAKGARRMKSAFHGGFDPLQAGEVVVYTRRGAAELRTLGSYEQTEPFRGIRESIPRFHAASHVAALVLALCQEEQPHTEFFDLTISALRAIDSAGDADAPRLALGFEGMALTLLGFGPELTRCVVCSKPARNIRTTRLSPIHGGLLCSACRSEDPRASPLRAAGVTALRVVCAGPLVDATKALADASVRADVKRALDAWTSALVDRRLP